MKNKTYLILIVILVGYGFIINYKKREMSHHYYLQTAKYWALNDSLQKSLMKNNYLNALVIKQYETENMLLENINLFTLKNNEQKTKAYLKKTGREKFVIRYSNIGCNTCVNLILKNDDRINNIKKSMILFC